ncbi:MAG: hypothetical protein J4G06_11105 [Caldilineaceae bacterium]|nr:hypothetical protein [Caldilineaceae bacterium]
MSIILSLSEAHAGFFAAGPQGMFSVGAEGDLTEVIQPESHLYATDSLDDRVLVGGAPHGVAFSRDNGQTWQAAWMDFVDSPVVAIAAAPDVADSHIVLAGTEDKGILRSANRGEGFYVCNYGLRSLAVLHICWAPPWPRDVWPRWRLAFAGTDEGFYRSPAAGRGWKRCEGAEGAFQVAAVDSRFHTTHIVLAGTETDGLWFSDDQGRCFRRLDNAPEQINALTALAGGGFVMSDAETLWHSPDGLNWTPLRGEDPCLVLQEAAGKVWAGSQDGLRQVNLNGTPA